MREKMEIALGPRHLDFGTYYEVAVKYDDDDERDYAFRCETEAPSEWPSAIRAEAERLREGAAERPAHRYRG